ncbi:hypothetical protein ETD83_42070 [Actinomadura soli]|uniref:Uncharacterized protein n=1 Tax=Actinomadura soli TaxID=2508997 RepID=A0A5C4J0X1_9ACTN|nr:hypothetical protein [Actinomadura soli]TMQ79419.1 hypothetical protein ETD83_42070 [Actinomadura soli]
MAEPEGDTTRTVLRAVDVLCDRAEDASSMLADGAAGLTLADAGLALETVTRALEAAHTVAQLLNGRVGQIRDREVTERRGDAGLGVSDGSALPVIDGATVHLDYACEVLMVAAHLLGLGLGELLRVERGEM